MYRNIVLSAPNSNTSSAYNVVFPSTSINGNKKYCSELKNMFAVTEPRKVVLSEFISEKKELIDKVNETPFIVQWFVKNNIEVWSVKNGQQRFETHTDKLINYLHFWQAAGESEKTSIRTISGLAQTVREGNYRGGTVPYGYWLVKRGRLNKRGNEVNDIEVEPYEADCVRLIFQKYVYDGYGIHRLINYLTEKRIYNHNGKKFGYSSFWNIIKNVQYLGILKSGETQSEVFPTRKADGTQTRQKRIRYRCYNKTRKICDCDGQTEYSMEKLDGIVTAVLLNLFKGVKSLSEKELIEKWYQAELESCTNKYKVVKAELNKHINNLKNLENEVIKYLNGESTFNRDILNGLILQTKEKVAEATGIAQQCELELSNRHQHISNIQAQYNKLIGWTEMFGESSIETKKMIVAQLIDKIKVLRGYEIDITFNVDYEQFCTGGGRETAEIRLTKLGIL